MIVTKQHAERCTSLALLKQFCDFLVCFVTQVINAAEGKQA